MTMNENEDIEREAVEWRPPAADAEPDLAGEIERLERELEQKSKEAAEAHDKYVRTYADFENYRKRVQRELADLRKYANEQIVLDLLTVVDHLELAIKHAAETGGDNQGLREGVKLVYKQFRDVLERYGIKPFSSAGEKFDPARHDAIMQDITDQTPENIVTKVFQEGYMYHDKVLRHAKVAVAKHPAEEKTE